MSNGEGPKCWGFRVGYNGYRPKHIPLPSPPFKQKDPDRPIWIEGWHEGRRLASAHWEIMEAYVKILALTEKESERIVQSRQLDDGVQGPGV